MTTTPAMPELPETAYSLFYEQPGDLEDEGYQYVLDEPGYTADQMRAYALATLQAQPAAVSDAEILRAAQLHMGVDSVAEVGTPSIIATVRAILALRPQAESEAPTVEAARAMGATGGPVVEAERLAFEAWMAGHCWAVSPTWNGETYDDSEEDKKRKLLDPLARTTRMLWAAWRDRAALSSLRPQAVPMTDEQAVLEDEEFSLLSQTQVAALLWVLWCHQGASSPVGQPIRFALGMDKRQAMSDEQVSAAQRFRIDWHQWSGITAPAGGEG